MHYSAETICAAQLAAQLSVVNDSLLHSVNGGWESSLLFTFHRRAQEKESFAPRMVCTLVGDGGEEVTMLPAEFRVQLPKPIRA